MADIYEVVNQTKYLIELKPVENIEDCPDNFITSEELDDMGIGYLYSYTTILRNNVVSKLNELLSQIKDGKKSVIIDDQDLIDALKETEQPVSEFVEGTRRVGNRLFKHTKKEKVKYNPTYNDWKRLVNLFVHVLLHTYGIDITIKLTSSKRQNMISMFKKMVKWEDIVDYSNEHCRYNNDEVVWMKKLYDDPTLINDV